MSSRVDATAERLQALAATGRSTEDLLEHVVSCLGDELSPLTFMASIRDAFGVPLFVLRDQVEGWVGLGRPGCDIPTGAVVATLEPFIQSYLTGRV